MRRFTKLTLIGLSIIGIAVSSCSAHSPIKEQGKQNVPVKKEVKPVKKPVKSSQIKTKVKETPESTSDIASLRPHIKKAAEANGVDPILIEAIIRHESAHGESQAARQKNNLAGIMGRNGLRKFKSKEDCIDDLASILAKYKRNGRTSINSIGRKYAEDEGWSAKVKEHYKNIKNGKHGAI